MTFNTTEKNTFKKDHLRGLEYKKAEYKPNSLLQVIAIFTMMVFICLCIKMCFDEPEPVAVEQLNADRR